VRGGFKVENKNKCTEGKGGGAQTDWEKVFRVFCKKRIKKNGGI